MHRTWLAKSYLTLLLGVILLWGMSAGKAGAESYCYINDVKWDVVSNAVQIEVKSDGILQWEWTFNNTTRKRQAISVRFTNARLKLDDYFIDTDADPVSTILFYSPQNATDGIGAMMEVTLSEPSHFKGRSSTDERTFVLTIDAPLRTDLSDGKTKKTAGKKKAELLSVEFSDGLVSVHALRADIHKVIAEVARKAGLNVTLDDAVSHKVNTNLKDMEPMAVIKAIAAGYGLALSSAGDVLMLSEGVPRDLTTYNRSGTASFPMRYLRAQDAKELLPTFITRYVQFNPEQNAVVATAPDQMLTKIGNDLKSVDLPPPLIMVEVLAVEFANTRDYERDLGWLYSSHKQRIGTSSATGSLDYEDTVDGGLTGGVIANTANLSVALNALETEGKAKIRSNPRIAAVNGKTASIFIGQDRFILVEYQVGGNQQQRIEAVPVGVKLEVRPWTGGNGEITTTVDIEVSNISEVDAATGLPLLSTRSATSTVRTRDGETIVIGGLRQRQKEVTRQKIPILGDLPIIGSLFQTKSTSNVDSELVIFVTPRILSVDGELLTDSQAELRERLLEPGDCGYEGDTTEDCATNEPAEEVQ